MLYYKNVYLLDDDKICNYLHKNLVRKVFEHVNIVEFTDPLLLLEYLLENLTQADILPDCIFLDINMPHMNAWEFLDEFAQINTPALKKCHIYIVTSSISPSDKQKSQQYSMVKGYYVKPLNDANMKEMLLFK